MNNTEFEKWNKYNKPELTAKQRANHNHYLKIRNLDNDLDNIKDIQKDIEVIPTKSNNYIKDNKDNITNELKNNKIITKKDNNLNYNQYLIAISIISIIGLIVYLAIYTDYLDFFKKYF